MTAPLMMLRSPAGTPCVLGPRKSAIRCLLGETVTVGEFVTDLSEYGLWSDAGPLEHRPPEFWVDQVHDACGGDW
jgi:hypothetical protein